MMNVNSPTISECGHAKRIGMSWAKDNCPKSWNPYPKYSVMWSFFNSGWDKAKAESERSVGG
jgi:hypothetical protein